MAWNKGDAKAIAKYHHPSGASYFYATGPLLALFDTAEIQAFFDAGGKVNIQGLPHLDVKVYGDTAVSTGYLSGAITLLGSEPQSGTWRISETWTKEEGTWKLVHSHASPLITGF